MQNGFDGIPLAVFTGITPSGTMGFALVALFLLFARDVPSRCRALVQRLLAVPLAVAWLGFIASATHLGTPANALYAFSNVGSSPLSNEVVAAVIFLFVAGVYWLSAFARIVPSAADRVGLVLCVASAAALLGFTSVAYEVPTVASWDTWQPAASMLAAACCGGPALALLVLGTAEAVSRRGKYALVAASVAGMLANVAVLASYAAFLLATGNDSVPAGHDVGSYPAAVPLYMVLTCGGIALHWLAVRLSVYGPRRVAVMSAGCVLVLAAAVLVRVPFYEVYLSVGF